MPKSDTTPWWRKLINKENRPTKDQVNELAALTKKMNDDLSDILAILRRRNAGF